MILLIASRFQFTHPGKGATDASVGIATDGVVSIHAPWEGCDLHGIVLVLAIERFNSRTLGRVRLFVLLTLQAVCSVFQFTHPGKGATRNDPPAHCRG